MRDAVIVIEPMCRGFEHAQFNAPLLQSIALAFPKSPIVFAGDPSHLAEVRTSIRRVAPSLLIEWQSIELPDRSLAPRRRFQIEKRIIADCFRLAAVWKARAVIFASSTDTSVVAAKLLLYRSALSIPVVMIIHGILAGLEDRSRSFHRWRGISLALRMPHPPRLRLVVPGRPILEYLTIHFPDIARHCGAVDHPSFWQADAIPRHPPSAPVRFGFFGVSAVPGFDVVVRIAGALKREGIPAEFSMVGHLNHPDDAQRDYSAVPDASPTILDPDMYAARAHSLTYALWTTRTHRSGLVASSTFLDALSFIKPVIYLANPLIDSYVRDLGDIGYRCLDEDEMLDVVRSLARTWPEERYRAQCAALLAGRSLFDPATVARSVRALVDETGASR